MYNIIIPTVIIIFLLFCTIFLHCRKKHIIRKIKCMSCHEKSTIINDIVKPFGYVYDACRDLFCTSKDAWQRKFGFCDKYDRFAPYAGMVYDYLPVYFDYAGKTWLIELWKGQYGINTGCETGLYHADGIIPPSKYKNTLFDVVSDGEMMMISTRLFRKDRLIAQVSQKHWWLTMFKPGCFSKPKNLVMNSNIEFPEIEMANAFTEAINRTYPEVNIRQNNTRVYILYAGGNNRFNPWKRFVRCFVLTQDKFLCGLFNCLTCRFNTSGDKLLYIYYYLPFVFRKILRFHRVSS